MQLFWVLDVEDGPADVDNLENICIFRGPLMPGPSPRWGPLARAFFDLGMSKRYKLESFRSCRLQDGSKQR
jgi:hypothetical protein